MELSALGQSIPTGPEQTPLQRIGAKLAQTWPARMGKDMLSAFMLPGEVYAGNVSMTGEDGRTNPEVINRSADLAGVMMGGGIGGVGQEAGMVVGSAATKAARNIDELRVVLGKDFPQVNHYVSESPQALTVSKVVVPPDARGQGVGTTFMKDVFDYADAHQKSVALTPSDAFGGNQRKLEQWYRSLGFVPNKGRKADYSLSESMYRLPE